MSVRAASVLLVPQAFKGTLSASDVQSAMVEGASAAGAIPESVPGSDGGDGLIEAIGPTVQRFSSVTVTGPLGSAVEAEIAWLDNDVAVIESRLICGLSLLALDQRNPLMVTSRGVGEAISQVAAEGASHVVVGLGGSAMVDGGWGMATALGWEFRDAGNNVLVPGRDRMDEIRFARGDPPSGPGITALCDVSVPFGGPGGAALFAEQKGVVREEIGGLISDIDCFASLREPWPALSRLPGAGAAGGLGFGLAAFAGARLEAGAEWVLGRSPFAECLKRAALVVAAEGRFDATSLMGKLTGVVVQRAGAKGVPVIVLAPTTDGTGAGIPGLSVVSGDGQWTATDIAAKTRESVAGALSLLGY